jgi:anhydro-N-acetylmuramic acid kinase
MRAIGLMSGTSLDGIDAALVQLVPRGASYDVTLLDFAAVPFDARLADRLRRALPPHAGSAAEIAALHHALGAAFASAAVAAAGGREVDYVASHGLTIWHDGDAHTTLQITDAFVLREALHATVCYDFRSADCAAGGHGAPLVPYVDALLLSSGEEDRVAVNIGGIANLTVLPKKRDANELVAFDSGPGNMLIDAFVRERTGGTLSYDADGALAARGTVDAAAMCALCSDPYFAAVPPKTTGRERFGAQFLREHENVLRGLSLEDGAATLTQLTASTLGDAIAASTPLGARAIVSGGGARNRTLMQLLQQRLEGYRVEASAAVGLDADAKEAIAFAVLGYETLRERAANVPSVTGARHPALLGAIAPYRLGRLLEKMEAECRT